MYESMAVELRDIFEIAPREGTIDGLVDIVKQIPGSALYNTFDWKKTNGAGTRSMFTLLVRMVGIDVPKTHKNNKRVYSVPDSYFKRNHGEYQAMVAHMPLPFNQPRFVRELKGFSREFCRSNLLDTYMILKHADSRWPDLVADVAITKMRTVINILKKQEELTLWSRHTRYPLFVMADGWLS